MLGARYGESGDRVVNMPLRLVTLGPAEGDLIGSFSGNGAGFAGYKMLFCGVIVLNDTSLAFAGNGTCPRYARTM